MKIHSEDPRPNRGGGENGAGLQPSSCCSGKPPLPIVLSLVGLLLAGLGVSTLLAQNQTPADGEDQVEVVIPDTGVIRRQLDLIAPPEDTNPVQRNPFAGKVVLFEADVMYQPYENVEIQNVAGHEFFVVEGGDENAGGFQYWLPVEKVQSIRVFNRMRDAHQFLQQGRSVR